MIDLAKRVKPNLLVLQAAQPPQDGQIYNLEGI